MATQAAPASRLMLMQMKFKEKQQQTLEERRMELFSGASKPLNETTNVQNSSYPGKVRAMFDERRRGAGIDRSQPLKPITSSGTIIKSKVHAGLYNNGINTAPSKTTTSIKSLSTPTLNAIKPKTLATKNQGLGSEAEDDEVDDSRYINESIQTLNNSMQNLNISSKKINNNPPNIDNNMKGVPSMKVVSKTNLAPVKVKKTPPPAAAVVSPTTSSKSRQTTTVKETLAESPSTADLSPKQPVKKLPSSAKLLKPTKAMSKAKVDLPEGMLICRYCQRHFLEERLPKHEAVCVKLSTAKRKVFDASEHRMRGTEAEKYVRNQNSRMSLQAAKNNKTTMRTNYSSIGAGLRVSPNSALKKNNWRQKHEEFIAAIRAAKELKAHLARGGKLSDLPPPPPSQNPDYIQCPHCGRRFNESAAERHIPKCATMLHNKPKPNAAKSTPASRTSINNKRR